MPTFILDPSYTIRDSCQARTILHYIHVSHHTIHTQTNINHPRVNEHPNSALPCSIPRSGWGVSLRRDVLAQARRARSGETCSLRRASPSPRRGLERGAGAHAGSCLGETPLAWARYSLAQNVELVAWATFRTEALGELPVSSRLGETDSLGRDLQVSPLAHLEQPCFSNQPNIQSVLTHQIERLNHTSSNQRKHRPKRLETKNSNFPYLEKLSEDPYYVITSTAAPRMHYRAAVRVE